MLSFGERLAVLSLAAFFLVQMAASALASLLAPAAVHRADRISPGRGADLLLALRLAPTVLAILLVAALAVPGYLRLEPKHSAEQAGAACWCAAILGAAIWAVSIARAWRAAVRSRRSVAVWVRAGNEIVLRGEPVWLADSAEPILALTGILHPRLVISRGVLDALSPRQLTAALRHERAHRQARDNWKRLLMLVAPVGNGVLEHGWARLAEWAADDRAVSGSPSRSVWLAEAVVRVARLGAPPAFSPLATSFAGDSLDLAVRVERLLSPQPAPRRSGPRAGLVLLALTAAVAAAALQPVVLLSVHRWLEELMN